ncbi:unnamed protein product, partial [Heligmosomoides polygyrus]
ANCDSGSQEEREFNSAQESPAPPHPAAPSHQTERCSPSQFRCGDGSCIEKSLECDRKYDCTDGTDETECEYFKEAMARRAQQGQRGGQSERTNGGEREQEEMRRRAEELRRREEHERRREEEEHRRELMERRREEEERRREEEERRREGESSRREEEIARREEAHRREELERRQQAESRRHQVEEIRRREEERRRQLESRAEATTVVQFRDEYDDELPCLDHEFQCHSGECIDKRRLCDTREDCADGSDESHCPARPPVHLPSPPLPSAPSVSRVDVSADDKIRIGLACKGCPCPQGVWRASDEAPASFLLVPRLHCEPSTFGSVLSFPSLFTAAAGLTAIVVAIDRDRWQPFFVASFIAYHLSHFGCVPSICRPAWLPPTPTSSTTTTTVAKQTKWKRWAVRFATRPQAVALWL